MSKLLIDLYSDLRYAVRGLGKTPSMTAIIVLTLALGLGATTAIFTVVDAVRLKPLPYANPDRVVQIVENVPAAESLIGTAQRRVAINPDELSKWRSAQTLSGVAVISPEARTLVTKDRTVQLHGARVSPALFAIRGVPPLLGRGLLSEEERPDAAAIVLSERAWREHLGSDPNVVGGALSLDGRVLTVVGVMPPEFGPEDFWIPFFVASQPGRVAFVGDSARLRDGVSLETARAEINAIGSRLRGVTPRRGAAPRFELVRELDQVTERLMPALRVLIVAVTAVLLIVCTNVANLLLVRGAQRQREIAIRRSLGATRGRVVRLVLTESLTLAVLAGLVGIALAFSAVHLLKSLSIVDLPGRFAIGAAILPRAEQISIDPTVLVFLGGLVVVTGTIFGLLPALQASRFGERGHNSGAQLSANASSARIGHVLATTQLGFATALLIGAGLLLHSFLKLAAVDPGFNASGVLSFELVVPGDTTAGRNLEVAEALTSRLQDRPDVTSAGFIDIPPLSSGNIILFGAGFVPEGMTDKELSEAENALPLNERTQIRNASPGYLRALGARLVEGSWPADRPTGTGALSVLVSQPYARRYFPGRSAIDATLRSGQFGNARIAGVVDDIHLINLEGPPESVVFTDPRQVLARQRTRQPRSPQIDRFFLTNGGSTIAFAARIDGDPVSIVADLRAMARDIDPVLAIDAATPMDVVLSGVTTRPRFYALLLSVFGAVAGFIAVIGVYGVLAYLVSQRTKEIGVRVALGAQQGSVLRLVLRRGVVMIAIGITAGVLGALVLMRYLAAMLYGITAFDAGTYIGVAAVFAAVAFLASYFSARRAIHVDPVVALRFE